VASVFTAISLIAAASASAATVTYHEDFRWGDTVIYAAAPGERNDATLRLDPAGDLTIRDPGIPMGASPADEATPQHCLLLTGLATCRPLPDQEDVSATHAIYNLGVFAGDRADTVEARFQGQSSSLFFYFDGGAGNDQLLGGPELDRQIGGKGADVLQGGAGTDDEVRYSDSSDGVLVSLDDVANDGVPHERDNVHSDIEDIYGSDYADVLVASTAANYVNAAAGDDVVKGLGGADSLWGAGGDDQIDGGTGNDEIYGNDGADTIVGGPGTDRVDGGEGDDWIDVRDGEADSVSCYGGNDTVIADSLDTDFHLCETVQIG
jgi:Ca2+-binding RTX toxin-like protein